MYVIFSPVKTQSSNRSRCLTTYTILWSIGDHYHMLIYPYCIQGAGKDIQQLFTAIDRRIEALKRNATTDQESKAGSKSAVAKSAQNTSFDEEDKESFLEYRSSPESSPEPSNSSTRARLIPVPILTTSPSPATQALPTVTVVSSSGVTSSSVGGDIVVTSPRTSPTSSSPNYPDNDGGHGRKTSLRRGSSASDKDSESTPNPPSSERSPSCEASTTTVSSSDNALESS